MAEDGKNNGGGVRKGGTNGAHTVDDGGVLCWRVHQSGFKFHRISPFKGNVPKGWDRDKISIQVITNNLGREVSFSMFGHVSPTDKHPSWYKIIVPVSGKVQFLEEGNVVKNKNKIAWIVGFAMRFTNNLQISNLSHYPELTRFTIGTAQRNWLKAMTAIVTKEDVRRRVVRRKKITRKPIAKSG